MNIDENQLLELLGAHSKIQLITQHYHTQPLYTRVVQKTHQPVVLTRQQLQLLPPQLQQQTRFDQHTGVYILTTQQKTHISFIAGGPCLHARPPHRPQVPAA